MSDFEIKFNNDLFGYIAHVKTGNVEQVYQYKVIGMMQSQYYYDVPLKLNIAPKLHDEVADVLLLVHSGFLNNTTTVYQVALKDCDKIKNPMVDKLIEKLEQHGIENIEQIKSIIKKEGVV